jgi:NAD-dependent deacetylase
MSAVNANIDEALRAVVDGDLVHARRLLERCVTRALFDPIARHNLAVVARLQGSLDAAWTHADAAVAFASDDERTRAVMLAHRALLDRLLNARAAADDGIRAALGADPLHRVSLAYAGLFARLDGDLATAIVRWTAALASSPRPLLPPLVRARLVGMIADARAFEVDRIAPAARGDSAIGAITELLASDGASSLPDFGCVTENFSLPATAALDSDAACSPEQAAAIVQLARNIVVLTGAGCSAESGLATRKDLWKRFDKDDAVSITSGSFDALWYVIEHFLGDDEPRPNPAHDVIASLPRVRAIITQNVDDLHQRAARSELDPVPVIELHGTLSRTHCHSCGADRAMSAQALVKRDDRQRCPKCDARAVRPSVVLFGECVPRAALEESVRLVSECDLLLVVGCAMDVAPASELPRIARAHGAVVLEVKRGPSRLARSLDTRWLAGTAATVLPALYSELAAIEALPSLRGLPQRSPSTPQPRGPIVAVSLPPLGESRPEGAIRWHAAPGSVVSRDEVICTVSLDKVDAEIPAPCSGRVESIVAAEGATVSEGHAIAYISTSDGGSAPDSSESPLRWPIERPERVRTELTAEFAPWTGAVRVLLDQIARAPLLVPDSALAELDADAMDWVADRANELASALAIDDAPRVAVFREPLEAARATSEQWSTVESVDALAPWARAWTSMAPERDPDALRFADPIGRAVSRAARLAGGEIRVRWQDFPWMVRVIFERVAQHSARSVARRGPTPDPPCPWRPMLALWLRGAWPFVLPDALGLWVPMFREGRLVAFPRDVLSREEKRALARRPIATSRAESPHELSPLSVYS